MFIGLDNGPAFMLPRVFLLFWGQLEITLGVLPAKFRTSREDKSDLD